MNTVLGTGQGIVNPYTQLDYLYRQVLEKVFSWGGPDDIFVRFRRVVGCIILSQDALPINDRKICRLQCT